MTPEEITDAFVVEGLERFIVEPFLDDSEPVVKAKPEPWLDAEPIEVTPRPVGGAIQLFDPMHGEVVPLNDAPALLVAYGITDLSTATVEDLGAFHRAADEARKVIGEAQGITDRRIVDLMDLDRVWTAHTPLGEFKTSSPKAGTVAYSTPDLVSACKALVEAGKISQGAMDRAVAPTHYRAELDYDDLRQIEAGLAGELTPAARDLLLLNVRAVIASQPAPSYSQKRGGIDKLLKGDDEDVTAAILACQVAVEPPPRKVTFKPARRD